MYLWAGKYESIQLKLHNFKSRINFGKLNKKGSPAYNKQAQSLVNPALNPLLKNKLKI